VGGLVEGWLLLVPKKHFICVGALPESLAFEFEQLKGVAASSYKTSTVALAHLSTGLIDVGETLAVGVDHAHLHILPARFDLLSAASPFLPENTRWRTAGLPECRAAYSDSKDYLYLEQEIGKGQIAVDDNFGSQLFRRGIARELGVPAEYNWREFPHSDNIERTITRAREWFSQDSVAAGGLEAAA